MSSKQERGKRRDLTVRIHTVPSPDAPARLSRTIDILLQAAARGTTRHEDSIKGEKGPSGGGLTSDREKDAQTEKVAGTIEKTE